MDTQVVEEMVMWPTDMAPPNNLRCGDVVRNTEDHAVHRIVVVGPQHRPPGRYPMSDRDAQLIVPGGGSASVTVTDNSGRHWEVIPEDQQTAVERVHAAMLRFDPPTQQNDLLDENDDPFVPDDSTLAWHLLYALLPTGTAYSLTDGVHEWPGNYELALALAKKIDDRVKVHQRTADKLRNGY